jgi:hypothetical protein
MMMEEMMMEEMMMEEMMMEEMMMEEMMMEEMKEKGMKEKGIQMNLTTAQLLQAGTLAMMVVEPHFSSFNNSTSVAVSSGSNAATSTFAGLNLKC